MLSHVALYRPANPPPPRRPRALGLEIPHLECHPPKHKESEIQPDQEGVTLSQLGPGNLVLKDVNPVTHPEGEQMLPVGCHEGQHLQDRVNEEDAEGKDGCGGGLDPETGKGKSN